VAPGPETFSDINAGTLTRPVGHEAEAEARCYKAEAEEKF